MIKRLSLQQHISNLVGIDLHECGERHRHRRHRESDHHRNSKVAEDFVEADGGSLRQS